MNNTTFAANVAEWLGGAMLFLLFYFLWSAQRSKKNPIDLNFLLVDAATCKITLAKFGGFLSLLASTWIVVYESLDKSLSDLTFGAYIGCWGAVKVANDYINMKSNNVTPGT